MFKTSFQAEQECRTVGTCMGGLCSSPIKTYILMFIPQVQAVRQQETNAELRATGEPSFWNPPVAQETIL